MLLDMWKLVRIWILSSWSFLTIGILLGSWWAYHELGWGGWWFWDPVENASLMPWLLATACIHSITKPKLNYWTLICTQATFILSILGTFFVRSGLLSSVHSFATDSTRGLYLLLFLLSITSISVFNWISLCFNTSQYERLSADFQRTPLGVLASKIAARSWWGLRRSLFRPRKKSTRSDRRAADQREAAKLLRGQTSSPLPHRTPIRWTALSGWTAALKGASLRDQARQRTGDNGAIRVRQEKLINDFAPANRATTPVFLKKQFPCFAPIGPAQRDGSLATEPKGCGKQRREARSGACEPGLLANRGYRRSEGWMSPSEIKRSLEQILFLQNFYLCVICIVVFCGTSAPLFFHWLWNRDVGTGAPFYNALCIPLFTSVFFVLVYAHYIQFNISMLRTFGSWRRPSLHDLLRRPDEARPLGALVCANSRQSKPSVPPPSGPTGARRPIIKPPSSAGSPAGAGDTLLFLYCIFFFFLHVATAMFTIGLNFLDSIYGAICFLLISSIIISSKKIPNSVSETFMTSLSSLPSRHIVLTPKLKFGHQPPPSKDRDHRERLFQFERGPQGAPLNGPPKVRQHIRLRGPKARASRGSGDESCALAPSASRTYGCFAPFGYLDANASRFAGPDGIRKECGPTGSTLPPSALLSSDPKRLSPKTAGLLAPPHWGAQWSKDSRRAARSALNFVAGAFGPQFATTGPLLSKQQNCGLPETGLTGTPPSRFACKWDTDNAVNGPAVNRRTKEDSVIPRAPIGALIVAPLIEGRRLHLRRRSSKFDRRSELARMEAVLRPSDAAFGPAVGGDPSVQMNVAHTGIVLFIIGILLSNTFKFEFTEQLHSGPSGIRLGSQICCLRSIDHSFAPTYHSICANLLVYQQESLAPRSSFGGGPLRPDVNNLANNMFQVLELVRSGQRSDGETSACAVCMFPEKRFYYSNQAPQGGPAAGGLATKVAIHSNLFTDFYSLIGTGSFETGWFTTIMKLPFIFCIWLGFMFGVIGGFFSLKKQLQKYKLYWL